MIGIDKVMIASALATRAHYGQVDRAGADYIFHPLAVALDITGSGMDYRYIVTALLHDVAEDTPITIEEISQLIPDPDIISALELLTHDKNVPYMDYIRAIKGNGIAREVKKADLRHNMDLSRLGEITERDRERLEKYKEAYRILTEREADGD